ncbi:hypothetical protein HNP55_003579 [Paucibacter oligotrophus]|uniref:Uncharacterized protein n=1 Tax=Roseateles oligotrophus TaxID=1769250 RepID=A0A840LEE7_9BURK|nr:hypothetical protein [Roseateles oligotrophus]MBB4845033.1 hypothetical protein [Roseateles oligotrophus]
MPAPTSVVYFDSTDAGAPTLNNAAGSLIGVLDACLINGYNLKTVQSITVSGGLATASCAGHGLPDDSVNLIAGVTDKAALNGRQRITVVNANTFTFDATGVPNGSAAGTLSVKRAPLGWAKQFANGNTKAVYQRMDPAATAMVLRIDDAGAAMPGNNIARADMYESMTDVDFGSGRAVGPAGGQYWGKGGNSTKVYRWILVGDSRTFYLFTDSFPGGDVSTFTSYGTLAGLGFGDIASYRAGDPFGCILTGGYDLSLNAAGLGGTRQLGAAPSQDGSALLARSSNGIGGSTYFALIGENGSTSGGGNSPGYPSPVDNGLVVRMPVFLSELNAPFQNPIRGEVRGFAAALGNIAVMMRLRKLTNLAGSDRTFLVVPCSPGGVYASPAGLLIDISGPWA